MPAKLKDFIRQIRQCKTQADERAVIAKESAAIRTSLKDDTSPSLEVRHQNIAKMLYIHMLGHSAHYGQIECLKLVAAGKYADKRLGYLGIMLLLDEQQEVLTLVTNSLKNDMNSPNMYTVGLALITMGDIASSEMSRDLAPEIERLMMSSNSYIKKKAILCAVKCVKKVPDLSEGFLHKAKQLLNERNHAVLLTVITLCYTLCQLSPEALQDLRAQIPLLCRHLKSLIGSGGQANSEHDVNGINDPFLQVAILKLLRVLGNNNKQASEAMNDVLAQVATNTDGNKNVGNSILYEICLTIMDIDCESDLRTLAINILGRFLSNTDNNIRYVALNTLTQATESSNIASATEITNAIQRHRATVLECLHDVDISIRRRALQLAFKLVTPQTVRLLIRELLLFLELPSTDAEFKSWIPGRICTVAEQFAPNRRWYLDTVLRVLKLAGNYLSSSDNTVLSNFIKTVGNLTTNDQAGSDGETLRAYVVQKLFWLCRNDLSQEGLVLATVWCVGEYGEILLQTSKSPLGQLDSNDDAAEFTMPQSQDVTEKDIIGLFQRVLESPYSTNAVVIEYTLTALLKISQRIPKSSSQSQELIAALLSRYTQRVDLEVQCRSVEYLTVIGRTSSGDIVGDKVRATVLEHVPVPQPVVAAKPLLVSSTPSPSKGVPVKTSTGIVEDLLSLSPPKPQPAQVPAEQVNSNASSPQTKNAIMDLYNTQTSNQSQQSSQPVDVFASLGQVTSKPTSPVSSVPEVVAYDKNGLNISMKADSEPGNTANIMVTFKNTGSVQISGLNFQVAVPKSLKLQLMPASSTTIAPYQTGSQSLKVTASDSSAALRLRLKVQFNGQSPVDEVVDFTYPNYKW